MIPEIFSPTASTHSAIGKVNLFYCINECKLFVGPVVSHAAVFVTSHWRSVAWPSGKLLATSNRKNFCKLYWMSESYQLFDFFFPSYSLLQWWKRDGRLCQQFNLKGVQAKSILFSPDFKTFVTVDNVGMIYVLKKISPWSDHWNVP